MRKPGELMLMYVSTMFFVQVVEELRSHPMLWSTVGVQPETFTMAAGMSTSGSLASWVQGLTGHAPFEQLVAEASSVPAGSNGLLLLPYFAGERTPIFDPRARGLILGLTLTHTRGDLFRAVYEGIAFGIRQILEFLDQPATPVSTLYAVGGGTQGGLWTQIVSDVTGREQVIPSQVIGASYGDALLAAIGAGVVDPSTNWAKVDRIAVPNPATRELYDGLYDQYTSLYPLTKAQMHHLATIQETTSAPDRAKVHFLDRAAASRGVAIAGVAALRVGLCTATGAANPRTWSPSVAYKKTRLRTSGSPPPAATSTTDPRR